MNLFTDNRPQKKKYCNNPACKKEIPWNKQGVYRDYCNRDCYEEKQNENKKLTQWIK